MRRILVNDMLSALPGHRTFWNDLQEWFGMEFVGGEYSTLLDKLQAEVVKNGRHLAIRNGSYFDARLLYDTRQICLIQDIFSEGAMREMQVRVMDSCDAVVFNSMYTQSKYGPSQKARIIPLPVDFSIFQPGNPMGLQQALSLPDGCICWVGACQGPAGHVKGWDIFQKVVRLNPDLSFVAVLKDAMPESIPPNLRCYVRLSQEELAKVMGACRVGLCTSRMESQHLAGIEMGACGLKLVVPDVGVYWKREDLSIWRVTDPTPQNYATVIRAVLAEAGLNEHVRGLWMREFDREVVRKQWESLIQEVENAAV